MKVIILAGGFGAIAEQYSGVSFLEYEKDINSLNQQNTTKYISIKKILKKIKWKKIFWIKKNY